MKFVITISALIFPVNSLAEVKQGSKEVLIDNDKIQLVSLTYPVGTESGMYIPVTIQDAGFSGN